MITSEIKYDQKITTSGHIERRKITTYYDDGVEITKNFHRRSIDPLVDDVVDEDPMTKRLAQLLKDPTELNTIMAGIEETETIEEGETAEGEEAERLTWFQKLAALFK